MPSGGLRYLGGVDAKAVQDGVQSRRQIGLTGVEVLQPRFKAGFVGRLFPLPWRSVRSVSSFCGHGCCPWFCPAYRTPRTRSKGTPARWSRAPAVANPSLADGDEGWIELSVPLLRFRCWRTPCMWSCSRTSSGPGLTWVSWRGESWEAGHSSGLWSLLAPEGSASRQNEADVESPRASDTR